MATHSGQEANAEMRLLAKQFRQMYIALRNEGFNEQQALTIIGQTIAGSIMAANSKNNEEDDK